MATLDLIAWAKVHFRDGPAGRLTKVVVDPDQLRVTGLVVKAGLVKKQARVFPIALVASAINQDIFTFQLTRNNRSPIRNTKRRDLKGLPDTGNIPLFSLIPCCSRARN
jgi:hypothetical protein